MATQMKNQLFRRSSRSCTSAITITSSDSQTSYRFCQILMLAGTMLTVLEQIGENISVRISTRLCQKVAHLYALKSALQTSYPAESCVFRPCFHSASHPWSRNQSRHSILRTESCTRKTKSLFMASLHHSQVFHSQMTKKTTVLYLICNLNWWLKRWLCLGISHTRSVTKSSKALTDISFLINSKQQANYYKNV